MFSATTCATFVSKVVHACVHSDIGDFIWPKFFTQHRTRLPVEVLHTALRGRLYEEDGVSREPPLYSSIDCPRRRGVPGVPPARLASHHYLKSSSEGSLLFKE
ncbi:hypothetical protein HPB50_015630 [Hyalomma asiaticum]|uniref:Uncharacterized protein n=1 Tax=Hyalomma asiaticum TaxID=266040 RepID=A0ACB7TAC5_HYAAI|nr:hypothetical protein HPB50_015630 [Hyalomma asiaticum]